MRWDEQTSVALGAISRDTPVILPIAATEQHGPHLPVGTDRMIVDHLATVVDLAIGDRGLILPTVQVGYSAHHNDLPGTLSVRHETLLAEITNLVASVFDQGFTTVVILNGHGGNQSIGNVALEQLGVSYPENRIVFTSWWQVAQPELLQISESGPGGVGHACELETSLILHIAPSLVDVAAIPERGNAPHFDWNGADMLRGSRARMFERHSALSPNGVMGEPTLASAAKGSDVTDAVVEKLTAIIVSLAETPAR
jgi:creatinine amidohydrolase